ncbi:MAG: isoprenylcysteine carboxylmethyltransferase family protein [Nitrososphaerales archaeon]|nr:isoprenylcysteine carboxylmethyltransferase family protein [Nitrososphaerales archaeon]
MSSGGEIGRRVLTFYLVRLVTLAMIFGGASFLDEILHLTIFVYPETVLLGVALIASTKIVDYRCVKAFSAKGQGTFWYANAPRKLVDEGPYGKVRNPLYLTLFLDTIALFLVFGSLSYPVLLAIPALCIHFIVVAREEPSLEGKFGLAYLKYKKEVPRWIPRFFARTRAFGERSQEQPG